MNASRAVVSLLLFVGCCLFSQALTGGKYFDRIFIIVFENTAQHTALDQPFFNELATKRGALLKGYYGVVHPSQPNYLAMIAGQTFHQSDDYFDIDEDTLVELMEAKNITWKAYQEDYPGNATNCFDGTVYKQYARKHNPFMTFTNVRKRYCHKIVNATELHVDVENGDIPEYMFYTPNMRNDAHDTNATFADKFLKNLLQPLLENKQFMKRTMILVTFDEDNYREKNLIYTALIGDMIKPGSVDGEVYNHYDMLRTVEDNWDLGTLGRNDATAQTFKILSEEHQHKRVKKIQVTTKQ